MKDTNDIDEQIKDCVALGTKVRFEHFVDNALWYRCDNGFMFPVPVSDTKDSIDAINSPIFLAEDKAIYFMRWIRKHIETTTRNLDRI